MTFLQISLQNINSFALKDELSHARRDAEKNECHTKLSVESAKWWVAI
jgi:hypothetical protein